MTSSPKNVYESSSPMTEESERLRTFDIPTQVSVSAIAPLKQDETVLDIGAGENPALGQFVHEQGGNYIALDFRYDAAQKQHDAGAAALQGDIRALPIAKESVNTVHSRFVLSHFTPEDRKRAIADMYDKVTPGGRLIFIDYDWSAIDGSEAIRKLRDLTIEHVTVFDAAYGGKLLSEVGEVLCEDLSVAQTVKQSPLLKEYQHVTSLRQVTIRGLEVSGATKEVIEYTHSVFDEIEAEAELPNPPGFLMPDIVALTTYKPEQETPQSAQIIEIDENELSWRTQLDAFAYILSKLNDKALYKEDALLFWGGEGAELLSSGTYDEQRETYAFTEQEYVSEAQKSDNSGGSYGGTALEFARRDSDVQPVICVYDASKFEPHEENQEVRFVLKKDVASMDDAVVAIIKLT